MVRRKSTFSPSKKLLLEGGDISPIQKIEKKVSQLKSRLGIFENDDFDESIFSGFTDYISTIFQIPYLKPSEEKYLQKLNFLVKSFDEHKMSHFGKNRMQMVSFCQSYNITCNQEFFNLNEALELGKLYAKDPNIDLEISE